MSGGGSLAPPDETDEMLMLALLDIGNDVFSSADDATLPQPATTIVDTHADELADAVELASVTMAPPAPQERGGRMITLPDGTVVNMRTAVKFAVGEKFGGAGATSSSRIHRVKLLGKMLPAGDGGSEAREPDLAEVIFPGSHVLVPVFVSTATINGVVGPGVVVGVGEVQDFAVKARDNTVQRPEYLRPAEVPDALIRLRFLHLARTLRTCAYPPRDDEDDAEEVATDAAAEGGAAAASGAGEAVELEKEEEEASLFASPYPCTDPVYLTGGNVLLANAARHRRGPFVFLSLPREDVDAAKAHFSDRLETKTQRELLSMTPRFDATMLIPDGTECWHIRDLTHRARAAVVPEKCRWPGCEETRYADKKNGAGRPFGMFKHLSLHAVVAAASPLTLETAALSHAANACGLCGSSTAGCTLVSITTKRGRSYATVDCNTPPFCDKMPSFEPSKAKAGKIKNVPMSCKQCGAWVWLFALRSHCALRHGAIELPPHALTEAGIEALKSADRVKVVKPVTDLATREQRRRAQAARRERAAKAGAAPPAAKRSRMAAASSGAAAAGGGGGGGGSAAAAAAAAAAPAAGAGLGEGGTDGGNGEEEGVGGGEGGDEDEDGDDGDDDDDDSEDGDGSEDESDNEGEPAPADDVTMPPLPKYKEGDAVTNVGLPGIVREVILGNDATGGLPMYIVRFPDHKGGLIEAELFESNLSPGSTGARVRTTWKERSLQLST